MTAPQPSLRNRGPLVRSISGGVLDAGFASDDVEKILELVPIATHNQRGRQKIGRAHV